AKTVFFSNVSHEFRTPLTLMLGPTEDSLSDRDIPLPTPHRERIELVQRNGLRLLKLVNALLDFSRIEAGRIEANYEPTDLATFTTELASVFRSAIERANLRLVVDCPPLSEAACVDREMWEKIVLNLLSNAFKFTLEGEIAVVLREHNDRIELEVRDTGTGIPKDELPHIFERFHRVQGAKGRSYEGSGIGLSLVQDLVSLHGGTIRVSSVLERGTSFVVSIPVGCAHLPLERLGAARPLVSTATGAMTYVVEALRWLPEEGDLGAPILEFGLDGTIAQSSPSQPNQPPEALHSKILLVDDNADMRNYVKRLLADRGYGVETAADAMAALAAIGQQAPDLVLTDVMMPQLDGFGLLQKLRSDPTTRAIPVILLSARAGEEARIEGLKAGADDYLTKPFSARELLARVEANLKLAQLRRDAMQQEQALRLEAETAKQTVETILSSINDGFYVLDRDWHYTYVNDRLCEIVRMEREEILNRSIWDLFPDVVGTDVEVQFKRTLTEQTPIQFEYLYATWNRWYEHRIYPSPSGLTVFVAEITARKQAELLLIEQKRLLELTASGHPLDDCLASVCASVSSLNPGTRACFLLADAQRQTFTRSITPDFLPSFGQGLKDAPISELAIGTCGESVYCGQPVTCADIANDECWSQEWRDLCVAHGILACHSAPVLGIDNLPLGSLMLCFNEARLPTDWEYQLAEFGTQVASIVFERDQSILALRESEERLRLAMEGAQMGAWDADLVTGKVLWSEQHFTLLGYEPVATGEATEAMWSSQLHPDDRERVIQEWQQARQEHRLYQAEYRVIRVDNQQIVWLAGLGSFTYNPSGEAVRSIGVFFDISERKQAEAECDRLLQQEQAARKEAENANRIKDEFLAVLSHELRSPLNPILGWATLLKTKQFDSTTLQKGLETIERNATLQTQLIEDLLDVSRILRGKLSLNACPVELPLLIASAMETVRLSAQVKGIEMQTRFDPQVGKVSGDPARLQQVIWNLLSNAVKFTPNGGQVEICLEQVEMGNRESG
ncbi:MAG: ATP-binding protein, partial [Microcystaceae cyanobacterium]